MNLFKEINKHRTFIILDEPVYNYMCDIDKGNTLQDSLQNVFNSAKIINNSNHPLLCKADGLKCMGTLYNGKIYDFYYFKISNKLYMFCENNTKYIQFTNRNKFG